MKYHCKSEIDRTGRCYRCGSDEHKVKECTNEAQCVVCKEKNLNWHHRMGSIACIKNRALVGRKNIQMSSRAITNTESNVTNVHSVNSDMMEVVNNTNDTNDK